MAFTQFTLDISINQARGIFDQYVYSTSDTITDIQVSGYFNQSRFINDPDWVGSLITCKCSDGLLEGEIESGGTITQIPITGQNADEIVEVSSTYTALVADDIVVADGTFTVTLPPVASAIKIINVKSVGGGGTITVDADGSETIDGQLTQIITVGASLTIAPTSAGWIRL